MDKKASGKIYKAITAIIFLLSALFLIILGGKLAWEGGSLYYLISGIVFAATAILLLRNRTLALWLYTFYFIVTIIWSLYESGTDFWALTPRLDVYFVFGIWLLLPYTKRFLDRTAVARVSLAATLLVTLAVMGVSIFNDPQEINGAFGRDQPATASNSAGVPPEDWPAYDRTQAGDRYSPLKQITDKNVDNLEVAWTYHTGDFKTANDSGETTNEVTPIKVGDTLYICTPHQFLDAINAKTGERKWRFDPKIQSNKTFQHLTCRGVSYYDASNHQEFATSINKANSPASQECPTKIILPVNDGRLIAVNAETGKKCHDFADNGEINLQKKMPYAYPGGYNPTSPPVVTGTTIIIGGSVTDNYSNKEPSGVIRGYDVNTGTLNWVFDTGAKDPNAMPGETTEFVHNSPNAWAPLAYDAKRDIVYIPTGVGTPDIWGGDRSALKERYANSILALDATTGKLLWHFQTTHHDLWDMDVPSQPSLMDVKTKNGVIPAIYALTKTGNIFVLNRETGEPIVDITEKPVPQKVAIGKQTAGEHYSKTQPFSALSLMPQEKLEGKKMWGATMFDQLLCRIQFKNLNYDGIYTPPSEQGTLVFPGNLGVFEWGGISVNQDRQIAVMNPIGLPFVSKLIPQNINREVSPQGEGKESGLQPMYGTPYGVEIHAFLSPLGLPCKQPSWGFVAGVDLQSNQIVWKKRIGTIRDSLPDLFQLPPLEIGIPGLGGSISTAGNLMFVAGTQDNYIRAYRVTDGKKVWQSRLPAGGQATPMTYSVDGEQYVAIMAGGHGSFGTKMGDSLVAYKLKK